MTRVRHSEKIACWFLDHEHHSWFWDCVHDSSCYQECIFHNDRDKRGEDLFFRGIELVEKAGSQPIWYANPAELIMFFIGEEEEILTRLNSLLVEWHEQFPDSSLEEDELTVIRQQQDELRAELSLLAKKETRLLKKQKKNA